MYQNAGVMLEMVDYAARNSDDVDRILLENLRSDAIQIRIFVLLALANYVLSQTSVGVRANACRAASIYTDMAARMIRLLQESAGAVIPDFVEAM